MLNKIKIPSLTLLFCLTGIFSFAAIANPVIPIATQPQPAAIVPAAPNINAKSYILMDAYSGKVLAENNADARLAPASLTKLMTMYVISSAIKNGTLKLDDKVHISTKAWKTGGSRMFLKANDDVPVRDLLKGIVVASGNDACVAMAEHLAGTEEAFATMMNTQAKALGMTNSNFIDSNGLPNPNHYSTARDLAILSQAIIKNFPEDYKLYSEKWISFNNIRQPNRNRLLWRFQYADGLKTGHTNDAGYCIVGSSLKDGTRLVNVVMGAPSDGARTEDSIRLFNFGYRFFETHKLYGAAAPLAQTRVWKGKKQEISVGLQDDLYVTMPAGQYKKIQANIKIDEPVKAPIAKGQPVGTLNIVLNNQPLTEKPLVALSPSEKGGLWRRFSDSVSFGFRKLFSRSTEKANNG